MDNLSDGNIFSVQTNSEIAHFTFKSFLFLSVFLSPFFYVIAV